MSSSEQNLNSGFTIVEILVVTGIIVIGLLGISSLVVQTLQAQTINRNQLVASMLAQEGLELVRNIRDQNWLDGAVFSTSLTGHTNNDFTIDYNGTINDVDGINNALLNLNGGYYTHSGGVPTIFYRIIDIIENTGWLAVTARVQWQSPNKTYEYSATTYLYDWR